MLRLIIMLYYYYFCRKEGQRNGRVLDKQICVDIRYNDMHIGSQSFLSQSLPQSVSKVASRILSSFHVVLTFSAGISVDLKTIKV